METNTVFSDEAFKQKVLAADEKARNLWTRQPISLDVASQHQQILQEMTTNLDVLKPLPIESHRPLLGFFIVALKKMVLKLTSPILKHSLKRQWTLNELFFHSSFKIMALQSQIEAMQKEIEELKKAQS